MSKRGPQKQYPIPLHIRVDQKFLDALDAQRECGETRSEALRRIVPELAELREEIYHLA